VLTLPGGLDDTISHPGGQAFLARRLVGVIEGDSLPAELIPRLMTYHSEGRLPVDRMIATFPFAAIAEAFAAAGSGQAIKPVLTFEDETP
jgi:aryl-alcohol dehydrogenase